MLDGQGALWDISIESNGPFFGLFNFFVSFFHHLLSFSMIFKIIFGARTIDISPQKIYQYKTRHLIPVGGGALGHT